MTRFNEADCVIRAQGLTKTYGAMNAVDSLDMNVHRGDIYGFVGRNGAGKSTTMKMVCGLISPTSGELEVLGHNPATCDGPTGVGAIIEAPGLLDRMSAMDNLMYKATALGVKNPKAHCQELLEIVNLANTGSKQTRNFSLGMKQRMGIALAMVGTPELLLLDEPFNGLDPAATHEMRQTLQRLNSEKGITIVVSTHVLDQLNRFATRFGVINAGKMIIEFEASRMAEMAAGVIRVRTTDMARAQEVVSAIPGAKVSVADDGCLQVAGKSAAIEDVSMALYQANLQVLELVQTKRDVEEFFLDLMNGKGQGASAAHAAASEGGR